MQTIFQIFLKNSQKFYSYDDSKQIYSQGISNYQQRILIHTCNQQQRQMF